MCSQKVSYNISEMSKISKSEGIWRIVIEIIDLDSQNVSDNILEVREYESEGLPIK